jgi:uncharacterized damage-inducible protein DinB
MSLLSSIRDQFRQMEWADALVWGAVLASEPAHADETLRAKLHHLHLVQRGFLAIWQGAFARSSEQELMEWARRGSDLRGTELMAWGRSYHGEAQQYLTDLPGDALSQPVMLPWADLAATTLGKILVAPTLVETLFQVTTHSTHHRGQINARLRELGAEPPLVDFIAWVWLGKPAAQWP